MLQTNNGLPSPRSHNDDPLEMTPHDHPEVEPEPAVTENTKMIPRPTSVHVEGAAAEDVANGQHAREPSVYNHPVYESVEERNCCSKCLETVANAIVKSMERFFFRYTRNNSQPSEHAFSV